MIKGTFTYCYDIVEIDACHLGHAVEDVWSYCLDTCGYSIFCVLRYHNKQSFAVFAKYVVVNQLQNGVSGI